MDNKIYYMCKYAPVEIIAGFGLEAVRLDPVPKAFDCADSCAHPNLCGFGKAVIEEVKERGIKRLILTDCCDVCRRIYDVLCGWDMDFLYLMPLPHKNGQADAAMLERALRRFKDALREQTGDHMERIFDEKKAFIAWEDGIAGAIGERLAKPHISLTGAHGGRLLKEAIAAHMDIPVQDDTCTGSRELKAPQARGFDLKEYAAALLDQKRPCMRMQYRHTQADENAIGIICHTVKFCDYYGFEYRYLRGAAPALLKIETDSTPQSGGQISTRIEAFAETLYGQSAAGRSSKGNTSMKEIRYAAGIDSGSASTDAVVIDADRNILGYAVLPTGSGAACGADKALEEALKRAGLRGEDIDAVVTTGYGRQTIGMSDKSVTEITCHAKGAHFLYPKARTVIDIGGQDSKVISLDEKGNVVNFVMNDKCAAGTGRFLEMMARTMELTLPEMSRLGLSWENDVTISSMCTVFAESEVVSLIANNTPSPDIIHGLNESVAAKTVSLAKRLKSAPAYVMTGGVARNKGVVKALEKRLSEDIHVPEMAQLCGALGAALFAVEGSFDRVRVRQENAAEKEL